MDDFPGSAVQQPICGLHFGIKYVMFFICFVVHSQQQDLQYTTYWLYYISSKFTPILQSWNLYMISADN